MRDILIFLGVALVIFFALLPFARADDEPKVYVMTTTVLTHTPKGVLGDVDVERDPQTKATRYFTARECLDFVGFVRFIQMQMPKGLNGLHFACVRFEAVGL